MHCFKFRGALVASIGLALSIVSNVQAQSSPGGETYSVRVNASALNNSDTYSRFIIRYRDGAPTTSVATTQNASAAMVRAAKAQSSLASRVPAVNYKRHLSTGAHLVTTSRKLSASEAAAFMQSIASDPTVAYVAPDVMRKAIGLKASAASFVPNDNGFAAYQTDYLPGVVQNATGSVVVGANAIAYGASYGVALGYGAGLAQGSLNNVAIGNSAVAYNNGAVAVGPGTFAIGPGSLAIGGWYDVNHDGVMPPGPVSSNEKTWAPGTAANAIGAGSWAWGDYGTAIGQAASATADGSVALGQGAMADRANTVSVGSAGNERQITNVAAGTQGTDAVNVSQLNGQTQQAIQTAQSYTDASSHQAVQSANAYTDQKVQNIGNALTNLSNQVNDQFKQQSKRIDQTGAMGAAMTQMAVNTAGLKTDNRVGAGIGGQGTQTALSVGYQRVLNREGSATLSVGGSVSNGGNASFGVGAGFGW